MGRRPLAPAAVSLIFALAAIQATAGDLSGADMARIVGEGTSQRASMLCVLAPRAREGLSAAEVEQALGALTGGWRRHAVECLEPKIARGLDGADLSKIVGSEVGNRKSMLCNLKEHLRPGLSAAEVETALGSLSGGLRESALKCLEPALKSSLSGVELTQIIGNELGSRRSFVCLLGPHARDGLTATEVSSVLGSLDRGLRRQAVECLEPKIKGNLTGLDLGIIVGPAKSDGAGIICALKNHRAADLNATQIELALTGLSGVQRSGALKCLESAAAPGATPTSPDPDPEVWIGAPFDGNWPPATDCADAKYPSMNCSLPSKHWTPYGGDWSVDLPKDSGSTVRLYAAPKVQSENVTAKVDAVTDACRTGDGGKVVTVGIYAGSVRIGWIKYAHVRPAVTAGDEINRWGGEIGTVFKADSTQKNCWYGPHVHLELDSGNHYACFNKGWQAGQSFVATNFLGFVGGRRVTWHPEACP